MQGNPCNKCRQGSQAPSDTWCIGCSSLEAAQGVLKVRWNHPGLRRITEETLLSAARLVRGFQNLDRTLGVESAKQSEAEACATPKVKPDLGTRSRRPRSESQESKKPSSSARPRQAEQGELPTGDTEDSEYTEEEEQPDEDEDRYHYRAGEADPGKQRPPLPAGPPPGRPGRAEAPKGEPRQRRRRPRGGTRHQRRYREINDPLRNSHKRLRTEDLEFATSFKEGVERRR